MTKLPDLSAEQLEDLQRRWNSHPGMLHLGARVDLSQPGTVQAVVDPIQRHHRGGLGTDAVNGAVISGVFDMATGLAGYLHTVGRRVGVAQLNVQFMKPIEGSSFEVVARPTRIGVNLIFTQADALDEHGRICAHCQGIVAVSGGKHRPPDQMVTL